MAKSIDIVVISMITDLILGVVFSAMAFFFGWRGIKSGNRRDCLIGFLLVVVASSGGLRVTASLLGIGYCVFVMRKQFYQYHENADRVYRVLWGGFCSLWLVSIYLLDVFSRLFLLMSSSITLSKVVFVLGGVTKRYEVLLQVSGQGEGCRLLYRLLSPLLFPLQVGIIWLMGDLFIRKYCARWPRIIWLLVMAVIVFFLLTASYNFDVYPGFFA